LSIQIICLRTSRAVNSDLEVHNFVVITLNHPATDAQLDLGHRFLLRALVNGGVEFVLVGSCAEFLNGVPAHVGDVDIVHACNATNVERVLSVLEALDVLFRIQPGQRLSLITRYGRLDLLTTLGNELAYSHEDLLPHCVEMDVCDDLRVTVLDLETSIRIREEVADEKDLAALPILRWTLEATCKHVTGYGRSFERRTGATR
jgi:hypothetical protein